MSIFGNLYYFTTTFLNTHKEKRRVRQIVRKLIKYSEENDFEDKAEIVSFLTKHGAHPFPYNFVKKYSNRRANVTYDMDIDLIRILHDNKQIFFPKNRNLADTNRLYWGLKCEQDLDSPHCYTQGGFNIENNSILVDIGCAEAMFSYDHLNQCFKIVLVESDKNWINAINSTFSNHKEKVHIFNETAGIHDKLQFVSFIETLSSTGDNFFFKIDVEGYEIRVLESLSEIFTKIKNIKVAIATYHNESDYTEIADWLKNNGFEYRATKKKIFYYYDKNIKAPYFRNCLIQASKSN